MVNGKLGLGKLGLWTNQFDDLPISQVLAATVEIEELGYSALWLGEVSGREATTQAALLLAATSRMTVATGVANVYGRDSVTMAQAQRTLLEAFPGRFVLGLGISHPWLVEQVRGLTFGPRVPTMRAYLDKMDATHVGPPEAEKRGPRVIGAVGSKMLTLAAERADGALPFVVPVEHTAQTRALLGPDAFLGVIQGVLLGPENANTRQLARNFVAESLPNRADMLRALGYSVDLTGPGADRLIRAMVAWGDQDAITRRVQEHLDAGADHVALSVIGTPPKMLPTQEWRALAGLLG
ncbi:TIGR03620 family F420-dependent LLM class oxidoreductase [Frankia sp. AgB1.9]|uniref:TIGR03620 family F420-dependent LLM class oxidoreductase n=1 Tax=unclassified Frankia TaxID=2632575 RepID=UPI0019347AF4|nr:MULTISPECIES: TIGR03620 family F420-dependent LLM class oxidoreductase [unclassified Frankia]MBL7492315.1 TIGR03620 family F420-dependent LLM class oxidoreductase [Frankia sp. AgW1.1]MBL7551864.1 TIGR03620 family F420-dependent LLM class oxidoreductase [Frankia sp. AgB1.9]MBL7625555.1 TIGR03620 family F420-dependent LLM class oxidoreductase [Frankia sp. AgB1.8]